VRWRLSTLGIVSLAVLVVIVVISPVLFLFYQTLSKPDVVRVVLEDRTTWHLLGRSMLLASAVAVTSMALGTALAWLTIRAHWPPWARAGLTVLLCIALAVPSYVAAFGLLAATGSSGVLGWALPEWFHARDYPLLSSWAVLVCCTYPYVLLSVRSSLMRECASLEEAAMCLGASRWRAFFTIALPRIAPGMIWGGMLAALYCLADFGAVSLIGYETLTWGIYTRYHTAFALDEARSLAVLLALVTLVLIVLMRFVRPDIAPATSNVPTHSQPVHLGWWLLPALVLMGLPLFVGVALPVLAALHWLSASDALVTTLLGTTSPAISTIVMAFTAALLVPLLALPIATLHLGQQRSRSQRAMRSLLTPLTLIGFALPGMVIAIAGISLALRLDQFVEWLFNLPMESRLYQSHLLLLLAYAALFLPEAVGPLRSNAQRIHAEQFDAASQFGGSAWTTWRRIALPQLIPGLAAGGALVFVTTAKELPATLLMAPPGFRTLATQLWGTLSEAYFAQAAAAALALLVVAGLGLGIMLWVERIGQSR